MTSTEDAVTTAAARPASAPAEGLGAPISFQTQPDDYRHWSLTIDGEVDRPAKLSLPDLQKLPNVERDLVIECGGNGRAGYNPPAKGNQWTLGAVGCAKFRGVLLRDVLAQCGLKKSALHIG